MKKFLALFLSIVMASAVLASCGTGRQGETDKGMDGAGKLNVVATLFPQYDFAKVVGGDRVNVKMLLPAGTESHSYDPTPSDIVTITKADIFLYTGKYMEPWADTIIEGAATDTLTVVDLSSGAQVMSEDDSHDGEIEVADEDRDGHSHGDGEYDPHIWLDLSNAVKMVQEITEAFCTADPGSEEYYRQNSEEYISELNSLDSELEEAAKSGTRDVIVFGGRFAYGYFVNRYGIEYVTAYESCSSEAEPSVKKISEIIRFVNENNIPVIYHEELSDPKVARSIAEDTGAELLQLNTCHNVTKEQFENGTSFLELMEQNLENLKRGLN